MDGYYYSLKSKDNKLTVLLLLLEVSFSYFSFFGEKLRRSSRPLDKEAFASNVGSGIAILSGVSWLKKLKISSSLGVFKLV